MDINEWFETVKNSNDDIELARHFLGQLKGYYGTPDSGDLSVCLDIFAAIRLHFRGRRGNVKSA